MLSCLVGGSFANLQVLVSPLVRQEPRFSEFPGSSTVTLAERRSTSPVPAPNSAVQTPYLPMGVPWRLPRLKPNSQAKVCQHSSEVTLQQDILAFEVPVEAQSLAEAHQHPARRELEGSGPSSHYGSHSARAWVCNSHLKPSPTLRGKEVKLLGSPAPPPPEGFCWSLQNRLWWLGRS